MTISLEYIGAAERYFETASTGKSQSWRRGQTQDVSDTDAALLMATGLFAYGGADAQAASNIAPGKPVTATTNLTGGSDFSSPVSTLKLAAGVTDLTSGGGGGGGSSTVYVDKENGMASDGVTDDTVAINALLATMYAAGGGTLMLTGMAKCTGQIIIPNTGGGYQTQPAMRITGNSTNQTNGTWASPPIQAAKVGLLLTYASGPKLLTLGNGTLEIDRITIKNTGTDTQPFIMTTNTALIVHDVTLSGGTNKNKGFVFGGLGVISGDATGAFQGYGTTIDRVFFDSISTCGIFNGAANALRFNNNTVSLSCGDSRTLAITAATNASPTVFTVIGHGFATTDKVRADISGFTGAWAACNGAGLTLTILSADTFSIPVNSTAFGAMAGSPVIPDGTVLDFVGSTYYATAGCQISGNLVEMGGYAYFARLGIAEGHIFSENMLFDATPGQVVAYYKALATNNQGYISGGFMSGGIPQLVGAGNVGNAALVQTDIRPVSPTYGIGSVFPFSTKFRDGVNLTGILTTNDAITGSNAAKPFTWAGAASFGGAVTMTNSDFNMYTGGQLVWSSKSKLFSSSNGYFTMWNSAQSGFTGLRFGTGSSAAGYPMIKVNGGGLTFVQADETTGSDIYVTGKLTCKPGASVTPANNGDIAFEATSNTAVTVKLKGSDGIVRSAVLTLA